MYKWACNFNDATSESAQLKMENHFKTIVITADMDWSRIDTVLQQIQDIYPKIKRFQYEHRRTSSQSLTPSICSLNRIRISHTSRPFR
jgi:hypothetical protein